MLKTLYMLQLGIGFLIAAHSSDAASNDYSIPTSFSSQCQREENENPCGPEEFYSDCVNGGCGRRKCSQLRWPDLCIDIAEEYCLEGCICKDGYLRNNDGDCVPIDYCPERNNTNCRGQNEYYENCAVTTDTADNYPCTVGCQCFEGYARNSKGKCVLDRGEIACGPNEFYSDCVNGGCGRRNCSQLRWPDLCIDIAEEYCLEGCVCKDGYLRNNDGDCVPINYCPEKNNTNCRGQNEYYENCAVTTDTADNYPCTIGCQCFKDYVRISKGKCVRSIGGKGTTTPETTTTADILSSNNKDAADIAADKIWQANADFSGKFLKYTEKSFVASPFSAMSTLGQIAPFANGTSSDQLLKFFNVDSKTEILEGFRKLLDDLKSPKNVTLLLGQKTYANKQFDLNPEFVDVTSRFFDSQAENLDFSQNDKAAEIINSWVKVQTNGLIPTLISPSILSALTRLVLVNAIYFKGNWLRPFNPDNTQQKDFYMPLNKTVKVNMMFQEQTFGYTENAQFKALQMFYKDKDYTFLCVLPTSSDDYSLEGLLKQLEDSSVLKRIIEDLRFVKVRVYVPSIRTSTTMNLKEIFLRANLSELFVENNTDLSGILKKPEPLYVSNVIQKAEIIINEQGSEAAAATAVVIATASAISSEPKIFEANRPYCYYILYKNNVIFLGTYTGT